MRQSLKNNELHFNESKQPLNGVLGGDPLKGTPTPKAIGVRYRWGGGELMEVVSPAEAYEKFSITITRTRTNWPAKKVKV